MWSPGWDSWVQMIDYSPALSAFQEFPRRVEVLESPAQGGQGVICNAHTYLFPLGSHGGTLNSHFIFIGVVDLHWIINGA